MAKEIKLTELRKHVENGMKKDELAAEYGLPKSQITLLLKEAGLKIRKLKKESSFKLIDDTQEQGEGESVEIPAEVATAGTAATQEEAVAPTPVPETPEAPAPTQSATDSAW